MANTLWEKFRETENACRYLSDIFLGLQAELKERDPGFQPQVIPDVMYTSPRCVPGWPCPKAKEDVTSDINAFEQNVQAIIAGARAMLALADDVNPPIEDITFAFTQLPIRPRTVDEVVGEMNLPGGSS